MVPVSLVSMPKFQGLKNNFIYHSVQLLGTAKNYICQNLMPRTFQPYEYKIVRCVQTCGWVYLYNVPIHYTFELSNKTKQLYVKQLLKNVKVTTRYTTMLLLNFGSRTSTSMKRERLPVSRFFIYKKLIPNILINLEIPFFRYIWYYSGNAHNILFRRIINKHTCTGRITCFCL